MYIPHYYPPLSLFFIVAYHVILKTTTYQRYLFFPDSLGLRVFTIADAIENYVRRRDFAHCSNDGVASGRKRLPWPDTYPRTSVELNE